MIERAVMSCWTSPRRWLQRGGLALWSLSAVLLAKRFRNLGLVADGRGVELLVERLGLPFTSVELMPKTAPWTELTNVWSLGKLFAVAHEAEPFLHFDSDVLLTASLPERILRAGIAFERPVHHGSDPCPTVWTNLALPSEWQARLAAGRKAQWGCGMMGGNNWGELVDWAALALRTAGANAAELKTRHGSKAAIFLEQWTAAQMFPKWQVETLFAEQYPGADAEFFAFYKHLGGKTKVDERNIERVATLLESEWPGQLVRCQMLEAELIQSEEIEPVW